jgi:hypothetical protein
MASVLLDGGAQQGIMAGQIGLHLRRKFLPEFGAAFDVGK